MKYAVFLAERTIPRLGVGAVFHMWDYWEAGNTAYQINLIE